MIQQILHRQLRVANHRLSRGLEQPGVPASCPRHSGFHGSLARFGNARQQNLGEAVHESE